MCLCIIILVFTDAIKKYVLRAEKLLPHALYVKYGNYLVDKICVAKYNLKKGGKFYEKACKKDDYYADCHCIMSVYAECKGGRCTGCYEC